MYTAERLNAHLSAGGRVVVATYTRATVYSAKHCGWFVDKADGVYVRHGRTFDYLGKAEKPLVGIRLA